jgi:hypothetical protein
MEQVYANMAGVERLGFSSSVTLTLPWRSRQLIMVNDTSAVDVEVFVGSGPAFDLKALETMSVPLWTESVRVSAPSSANFRLIGVG